ncbi:MAG: hypothetical protein Q9227_004799 [Pyrenula ochraceoflavens]
MAHTTSSSVYPESDEVSPPTMAPHHYIPNPFESGEVSPLDLGPALDDHSSSENHRSTSPDMDAHWHSQNTPSSNASWSNVRPLNLSPEHYPTNHPPPQQSHEPNYPPPHEPERWTDIPLRPVPENTHPANTSSPSRPTALYHTKPPNPSNTNTNTTTAKPPIKQRIIGFFKLPQSPEQKTIYAMTLVPSLLLWILFTGVTVIVTHWIGKAWAGAIEFFVVVMLIAILVLWLICAKRMARLVEERVRQKVTGV